MFLKKIKHHLTKPEKLDIDPDKRIIDAGLLAMCIIFIPYLLSTQKPGKDQTSALLDFCIAVP